MKKIAIFCFTFILAMISGCMGEGGDVTSNAALTSTPPVSTPAATSNWKSEEINQMQSILNATIPFAFWSSNYYFEADSDIGYVYIDDNTIGNKNDDYKSHLINAGFEFDDIYEEDGLIYYDYYKSTATTDIYLYTWYEEGYFCLEADLIEE